MPEYIGFSTINAGVPKSTNVQYGSAGGPGGIREPIIWGKKYRLVDEQLVIQDLINAFNIPKGSKVGQPEYGTTIWSFVFDPNTADVQFELEAEIRRLIGQDNRLAINYVKAFPKENGILIEVEIAVVPFNQPTTLNIYVDQTTNRAYQY